MKIKNIASFAYNLPSPALDGNVYRVLARLYDSAEVFDTSAGKKHFHTLAVELLDTNQPRLFNSALMELGALQCLPQSPDCAVCPLETFCKAHAHGTVEWLPVRKPRTQPVDRFLNYTVYWCGNRTIIYQRQGKDIWQHLWEFPLEESRERRPKPNVPYHDWVHVLSHQRLHARFVEQHVDALEPVLATIQNSFPNARIVTLEELDHYPLSRLTEKELEHLFARA